MGCRIPYDGHDENGEQQVNPRARKREQTGGVRPVNEGIREERQVCDAGEDRADGEQDTERLPEGKITDPMEEYCKQDKGRQDPEVSRNPEICADEASGESPEERERDTGEKKVQWFSTKPVLDRKKAENRAGHHGKKLQKIPHDKGPEWAVHTQHSPLVSIWSIITKFYCLESTTHAEF